MSDTSSGNLSADSPITNLTADCLGYRHFAKNIATILDNATTREDCLVLGIHGEWGSGKTSAINLVIKELEDRQENLPQKVNFLKILSPFYSFIPDWMPKHIKQRTTIIHFSPWLFSNQENLTTAFFHELEKQLDNTWGNIKGFLKVIAALTLPSLEALSYLNPTTSKLIGNTTQHLIKNLQKRPSLEQAKQALNKALKSQKRPILIIIDDIDRLPADEMRQIFRMVKAVADLPYVTYLLGFDRKIVERALEKETDLEGPQWIEKIVQGSFDLPHIIPFRIELYFWNKLKTDIPDLYSQLDHDTAPYFKEYLFPQLKSLRQVTRLINALIVGWLSVKDIVNPTFFVIIESWRLFNHDLYKFIKSNIDNFYIKNAHHSEIFTNKIDGYEKNLNIHLKRFLNYFRPIDNQNFIYHYFIYNKDSLLLSPSELLEIEESLDHIERAEKIIIKLSNDTLDGNLSKIRALIFYWTQNLNNYSEDKITKIIYWVISIYDKLISIEKPSFEYNTQSEISNLIINLFERIKNEASQQECILKLFNDFPFCPLLIDRSSEMLLSIGIEESRYLFPSNTLQDILKRHQDKLKEIYQTKITELISKKESLLWPDNLVIIFFNLLDQEWIENFLQKHLDQTIRILTLIIKLFTNQYTYLAIIKLTPLQMMAEKILNSNHNESSKQTALKFLEIYNKYIQPQ